MAESLYESEIVRWTNLNRMLEENYDAGLEELNSDIENLRLLTAVGRRRWCLREGSRSPKKNFVGVSIVA